MAADTTRADIDVLMAQIADKLAKGDGIEPGFLTTEFWLMILAVTADLAGPYIGLSLSSQERIYIAGGLATAYGAFRSWRKRGGPARMYADLLVKLAELRQAVAPVPAPPPATAGGYAWQATNIAS
jgi:hypothetical protein